MKFKKFLWCLYCGKRRYSRWYIGKDKKPHCKDCKKVLIKGSHI